MRDLLTLLRENNLEETANRARIHNATEKDIHLLEEVAFKTELSIEGRLSQLESIARAVQVATLDETKTGIFSRIDGFNLANWLEEGAQTLQALFSMKSDYEQLSQKVGGAE